jgi:extracellular factor (EF) 3-hydroxypalmitic acid methyl ester biosynthesis protein
MQNHSPFIDHKKQEEIMEKIRPLLEEISNAGDRRLIEEFWTVVGRYIGIFHGVNSAIEEGRTDQESGSEIVMRETDAMLVEGKKLEKSLDNPALIKKIKKLFRECAIPLGAKSDIVMHAFTKPRGYAGDYGLLEIIYNDRPLSRGFGYCIDRRFQVDDYARAVRSRMKKMKEIMARLINDAQTASFNVLNIACGSCREIREILDEGMVTRTGAVSFTLVDQDKAALDFAREALSGSPRNITYDFQCNSIYDYVKDPARFSGTLTGRDLVYTIGLADYIPDDVLKKLVSFMYGLLRPGGTLVIAHKDSKNFSPLAADWWCDWTFHLRDEDETVGLVRDSGIADYTLNVIREAETNIIFFIMIEKKK